MLATVPHTNGRLGRTATAQRPMPTHEETLWCHFWLPAHKSSKSGSAPCRNEEQTCSSGVMGGFQRASVSGFVRSLIDQSAMKGDWTPTKTMSSPSIAIPPFAKPRLPQLVAPCHSHKLNLITGARLCDRLRGSWTCSAAKFSKVLTWRLPGVAAVFRVAKQAQHILDMWDRFTAGQDFGKTGLASLLLVHDAKPRQQLAVHQVWSVVVWAVSNRRQERKPGVQARVGQSLEEAPHGTVGGREGVCVAPQDEQGLGDAVGGEQHVGARPGRACSQAGARSEAWTPRLLARLRDRGAGRGGTIPTMDAVLCLGAGCNIVTCKDGDEGV